MKTIIQAIIFGALCVLGGAVDAAYFQTVVIDAGHGGHDHGGQWGRVYEKHLALDTAYRLEAKLKKMGYRTVMTRRGDYFLTLQQRTDIANQYRNAIFVCIHYNFTTNQAASGLETFYYNEGGRQLSQHVQSSMIRRTRTVDRRAKFARFFVLRNTKQPAILVEGGFVSNAAERDKMKSAAFRDAIAQGVAEGIHRYRRN